MPELHHQLAQARETFGRFLRNWRRANGWVITTPQDWARACPELFPAGLRVSSGQWANLENAQIKQAQPSTFLQLAALNQALAGRQRGLISDALLKERVAAARPVLHADGTPWGPQDWFASYIGNLEGPAELWPGPSDGAEGPAIEGLKQRFLALVEEHRLRPITAMVQLLSSSRSLSTPQQLEIEGALLQDEPIGEETLPVLQRLLDSWETTLGGGGEQGSRRRRK